MSSLVALERAPDRRRVDLVLCRPSVLNALNLQMLEELHEASASILEMQPLPRVIVVRSSDSRSFSVGADINEWERFDTLEAMKASLVGLRSFERLASLPMPVVALVTGYCFGGGLELALACDLRIVVPPARLAFPEASLGTGTGWGGLPRLVRLIGPGGAKAMLFTGGELDAEQARKLGVCEFTAPTIEAADELIARIEQNAPLALEIMKRTIDAVDVVAAGFQSEALSAGVYAATEDARRAKAAFREKGPRTEFHGE